MSGFTAANSEVLCNKGNTKSLHFKSVSSLLTAGFFSKDERLVIANAKGRYGVGRVEKKVRQGWYG